MSKEAGREAACIHDGKKYAEVRAPQQSAVNRCIIIIPDECSVKLLCCCVP